MILKTLKLIKYLAEKNISVFNWRDTVTRGPFKELKGRQDEIIETLKRENIIMPTPRYREKGRPKKDFLVNPKLNKMYLKSLGAISLRDSDDENEDRETSDEAEFVNNVASL